MLEDVWIILCMCVMHWDLIVANETVHSTVWYIYLTILKWVSFILGYIVISAMIILALFHLMENIKLIFIYSGNCYIAVTCV